MDDHRRSQLGEGNVSPRQVPVSESHASGRAGWLRAAILGADDGLVSTASLLVGVAATTQSSTRLAATGVAALVAGAMSMAAGEWVSVSSQRDTERADIATNATSWRVTLTASATNSSTSTAVAASTTNWP